MNEDRESTDLESAARLARDLAEDELMEAVEDGRLDALFDTTIEVDEPMDDDYVVRIDNEWPAERFRD